MKKKNSKCDYTETRNKWLLKDFIERLGNRGKTLREIFRQLEKTPARRFYISEERARHLIKRHRITGQWPASTSPTRRALLEDLAATIDRILDTDPGIDLREAVFRAVNSPAPSYYLTAKTIKTIIYKNYRHFQRG